MADIQKQFPKSELPSYCSNPVLNALLASYSERCAALNIKIELTVNTQGTHLAIMVKNNFSGEIKQDNGLPVSVKKDGGLGLRSVQAVAARYGGELMTEWDDATFLAYVLMRLQ